MAARDSQDRSRSTRSEGKLEFRRSIMTAALEEFSEKGFHKTQISDIARSADVAVGTIYNIFGSKESLYENLIIEHSVEIFGALNEALKGERKAIAKLLDFIRIKGEIYEDNKEIVNLFFRDVRGGRINARSVMGNDPRNMYDALLVELAEICKAGIEEGSVKDVDPFDLAIAIDSVTNSFVLLEMDQSETHVYASKLSSIQRLLFEGALTPDGLRELTDPID